MQKKIRSILGYDDDVLNKKENIILSPDCFKELCRIVL